MAGIKDVGLMNMVAFIGGLLLIVVGYLSFAIGGQVTYYVDAQVDASLWQEDDLKYVNASASKTNTYGVDDANLLNDYEAYLDFKEDSRDDKATLLNKGGLVVGLIGLIIVISVLMGPNGIIRQIRGSTNN
jgi:hypothetical protein